MAMRFPKANTWFQAQTDSSLLTYAINVRFGLIASAATFPTPPVLPAALLTLINNYSAALALATGPGAGKENTAAKNTAKLALIQALRQDAFYVNQIITGLIASGTTYTAAQELILETGYQLSKEPTPAGPLPPVELVKYGSYTKGQYYILIKKIVNAKGYVVRVFPHITGAEAYEVAFPSTRMTLTGLQSGRTYSFQIAAIGTNPDRNFATEISEVVVI